MPTLNSFSFQSYRWEKWGPFFLIFNWTHSFELSLFVIETKYLYASDYFDSLRCQSVTLFSWLWTLKIYFERLNFHLSQTTLLLPSSLSMKLSGFICLCSLMTTQLVLIRYISWSMMNCPLQKIDVANPIYFLCHSEPTSCWILSRRSKPIEMCPEIGEVFWLWLVGPKEWEAVKKVEEIWKEKSL